MFSFLENQDQNTLSEDILSFDHQKEFQNNSDVLDWTSTQTLTVKDANQVIIEAAREDPFIYGEFVFGYEPAAHHIEWINQIFDNQYSLIISPRESAKTTWVCVIFMCWYICRYPERTSIVISVNDEQAKLRLDAIRRTLKDNPRHKAVFHDVFIDEQKTNTAHSLNLWSSRFTEDGSYSGWLKWEAANKENRVTHSLMSAPVLSNKVVGNRFSGVILFDDLHDQKNTNTRDQIQKTADWVEATVLPCLRPEGKAVLIGTRWTPNDIPAQMKAKRQNLYDDKGNILQENVPIWSVIETQALIITDEGQYISYWPDNWPVPRLLAMRDANETIFELMYNNNPYALSGDLFTPEMLEHKLPINFPAFKHVAIGMDLAFKTDTRNDNTAMVLLGIDYDDAVYNIAMKIGKMGKLEIAQNLITLFEYGMSLRKEKFSGVFVEEVGADALVIDDIIKESKISITKIKIQHKGDKVARAQTFSSVATRHKYYCDWNSTVSIVHRAELLSFPTGPNDDSVDAISVVLNQLLPRQTHQPETHVLVF